MSTVINKEDGLSVQLDDEDQGSTVQPAEPTVCDKEEKSNSLPENGDVYFGQ